MKPLVALMFVAMMVVRAFGTAQAPDILILDGKEVPLFENPLEAFWPDGNGRPNIEAVGLPREEIITSSNNWRGYVAEWAIRGDRLFLTDLSRRCGIPKWRAWMKPWADDEYRSVPMELVLPGKELPVFAEWYSGRLKIPQGKMTRYVHMGYGSEYERELLIEIKNGVVVGRAEISTTGKNEFRSVPDLEWCALAKEVEDKGGWVDVRLFATRRLQELVQTGEEFRTRGVFFRHNESKVAASLVVFETRKTKADNFPIHKLPPDVAVKDGSHVEVTARFVVVEKVPELQVFAIRELKGGESMHAASFPAEWEELQAEEAVERAEKAKRVAAPVKAE